MRVALPFARGDLGLLALGAAITLAGTLAVGVVGATATLGPLVLLVGLSALVGAFVAVPHIGVAATIPLFAVLPSLKALVVPWSGPLKELVVLSAVLAALIVLVQRRATSTPRTVDSWVAGSVAVLLSLYVLNVGGLLDGTGLDLGWVHGVRLTAQPLLLLLVGLTLPDPRRTLRWASISLIATTAAIGLYGVAQQAIGPFALVDLGYEFNVQVRFFAGRLRSFGTLDDPFAYAALLLFGLTAVLLWANRRPIVVLGGAAIAAGLVVGYVRTSALIVVALVGLWLARRDRHTTAFALLAAAAVAAPVLLLGTQGATQTRTVVAGSSGYLTLNGRTSAWEVALGDDPAALFFGRGVGTVGTAANRATYSLTRDANEAKRNNIEAVDSGYFATLADIGFVGLVVLTVLYARLTLLAAAAARAGLRAGWLALGILVSLLLDAVTRDSFTGFPTAFVGLLLVGVALAAAHADRAEALAGAPRP